MSTTADTPFYRAEIVEPFWRYAADWTGMVVRTDTPDLIGLFEAALGEAQAYREMAGEYRAAAQDLAPLSFKTFPSE